MKIKGKRSGLYHEARVVIVNEKVEVQYLLSSGVWFRVRPDEPIWTEIKDDDTLDYDAFRGIEIKNAELQTRVDQLTLEKRKLEAQVTELERLNIVQCDFERKPAWP